MQPLLFSSLSLKDKGFPSLWQFFQHIFHKRPSILSQNLPQKRYVFNRYIKKRLFKVLETFLALTSVYIGLQWMPSSFLVIYEHLIVISHPLMTLLEGFCFMIVLLSFGQWLINLITKLDESEDQTSLTVVKVCFSDRLTCRRCLCYFCRLPFLLDQSIGYML